MRWYMCLKMPQRVARNIKFARIFSLLREKDVCGSTWPRFLLVTNSCDFVLREQNNDKKRNICHNFFYVYSIHVYRWDLYRLELYDWMIYLYMLVYRRVRALKILVAFYLKVGGTALHYAASRGHVEVARELLNHKAYVNGRTKVCANNL